jgi:hypothetical protein
MLGYNLLENSALVHWSVFALIAASALSTFTGSSILKEENELNTTVGGKRLTYVRRYKVVDGKLEVHYEELWIPNYFGSVYNSQAREHAPEGTEWGWLDCKKEWGFTEEVPDPPVFEFMSPGMKEIADEIIKNN